MPRLAALVLAAALVAAGASAQTLRWASQGDPQTMDPHSQNESMTNMMNGQVYERLTSRDRQLKIVPGLATEWQQVSPLVWRAKLRPGVKFHDGSPMTADDVVFSILRAQQPTSQINNYAAGVGTPVKVDELTVEFRLKAVNPIFLEHLDSLWIMSKGWSEKNKSERPLDFKNKEELYTAFHTNGTGPYMLVSRAPGIKTVYRRNPNYWGGSTATSRTSSSRRSPTTRRGWRRWSRARSTSSSTRRRATSPSCATRRA
jgi:peptide/nickel transport system substrate-binding protein